MVSGGKLVSKLWNSHMTIRSYTWVIQATDPAGGIQEQEHSTWMGTALSRTASRVLSPASVPLLGEQSDSSPRCNLLYYRCSLVLRTSSMTHTVNHILTLLLLWAQGLVLVLFIFLLSVSNVLPCTEQVLSSC